MIRKPLTLIMIFSMYVNAGLIPNYFLMKNPGMPNSFSSTLLYNSQKVNLHTLQYKLMEYLQSSQAQARGTTSTAALAASQAAGTINMVTPGECPGGHHGGSRRPDSRGIPLYAALFCGWS
jgi:hypothetical protein